MRTRSRFVVVLLLLPAFWAGASCVDRLAGPDADPLGENGVPSVTIATPAGQTVAEGTLVSFRGTASDPEDGDLTPSMSWMSDLDGLLGTGGTFERGDLSVGAHRVVATVVDRHGVAAADTAALTVVSTNTPPRITILLPRDGAVVASEIMVAFIATATDQEDGLLASGSIVWNSSLDGFIGTGPSFARAQLSVGTHVVKATATDSRGASASDEVRLTVTGGS